MPVTRSSQKKQARLAFEPVPSSSPQAKQLSPAVRKRAAVVRFVGDKATKKRLIESLEPPSSPLPLPRSTTGKGFASGLRTPDPSSQLANDLSLGMSVLPPLRALPRFKVLIEVFVLSSDQKHPILSLAMDVSRLKKVMRGWVRQSLHH